MSNELVNQGFYDQIKTILLKARETVYRKINFTMAEAYWNVGRMIVEEEQKGKARAEYGKSLIKYLSDRLTQDFGQGFSETNIRYMRLVYRAFPIHQKLSDELSWSQYILLSKIEKEDVRQFYFNECIASNWGVTELDRQINSLLYERLVLSKNKEEVMEMAQKGHEIKEPSDLVKDPYILEFTGLKQDSKYFEKDLENALIDHLQEFLLELGRGFSFVARQKRITLEGDHFYHKDRRILPL